MKSITTVELMAAKDNGKRVGLRQTRAQSVRILKHNVVLLKARTPKLQDPLHYIHTTSALPVQEIGHTAEDYARGAALPLGS